MRGFWLWVSVFFFAWAAADVVTMEEMANMSYWLPYLQNVSEACETKLINMANHFLHDDAVTQALANTGKGINDLGNYKACSEIADSRYVLLSIQNLPLSFAIGLCAPRNCTIADYEGTKAPLAKILNDVIQAIKPKESEVKLVVKASDIWFIDSWEVNNNGTSLSTGTVVTLGLVLGFVVTSIIAAWRNSAQENGRVRKGLVQNVLKSFDIAQNMAAFLEVDERHDQNLRVFNGIRVLSILWIILGHAYMIGKLGPAANPDAIGDSLNDFSLAHIYNAGYSVDIFFFLSGFFLCYILLSSRNTRLNWKLYLHRLIRLYPALGITYLVYVYVSPLFADGPNFYNLFNAWNGDCKRLLPHIFFFAYNFRPQKDSCMGWVWYLACDMQFFAISPPLIYVLTKWPRMGLVLLVGILLACYGSTIAVALAYDIYASLSRYNEDYNLLYYDKPYARLPTYLLGIIAAYFYIQSKKDAPSWSRSISQVIQNRTWVRVVCYVVGLGCCVLIVQTLYWLNKYPNDYPRICDLLFLVFSRTVFILCLCLFCAPALVGKGRVLHLLLSNKLMSVLAKLTYGVYLLHCVTNDYFAFSLPTSYYSSYMHCLRWFVANCILAYIGATVVYLFIESPIFALEDTFLKRRQPKSDIDTRIIKPLPEEEISIVPQLAQLDNAPQELSHQKRRDIIVDSIAKRNVWMRERKKKANNNSTFTSALLSLTFSTNVIAASCALSTSHTTLLFHFTTRSTCNSYHELQQSHPYVAITPNNTTMGTRC